MKYKISLYHAITIFLFFSPLICSGENQIGRPVHIVSIGFPGGSVSIDQLVEIIDRECKERTDIVLLPETLQGQSTNQTQTLEGDIIKKLADTAKKNHTYIIAPIDRKEDNRRLNSSVAIDRQGAIACVYDKVFPYWSEYDLVPPVQPGKDAPVLKTDFGIIGFAICFDANYPEVWKRLAIQGVELVLWSSAYSAGTSLQAHALNHHYYIVTSTYKPDCLVYDIAGEEVLYEKNAKLNISHVTVDLDKGIYHYDFNMDKLPKLLAEHPDEIEVEKKKEREAWFILKAKKPGISARQLAKKYGLEELRDYITRSRQEIDKMRGFSFEESVIRKLSQ